MKKNIKWIIALLSIMLLVGCGNKEKVEDKSKDVSEEIEMDDSLKKVQDSGKLTIGIETNWVPYVYNEEGTGDLTGFEVEIAEEIAKRLDVVADFNVSNKWDGVIAGLDAKRYDSVICGVNPNKERKEKYGMSDPYAENPYAVVVKKDNDEITKFEDLKGKKCGNSLASTAGAIARKYGAEVSEASIVEAVDLITLGHVDATVNNLSTIIEYQKEKPDADIKVAAIYEPEDSSEIESAVMLRKEDESLLLKINEIIAEMIDDGTCYEIAEKYFGKEVADNITIY